MTRFKLLITVFSIFSYFSMSSTDLCSCGSYENGTYEYQVIEESGGCCSGLPANDEEFGSGNQLTWERSEGGWRLTDIQAISNSDAQNECCQESA